MGDEKRGSIFLTFDVEGPDSKEDFVTPYIASVLREILELLEKHKLRAMFFITAGVLEQIVSCTELIQMMERHEIGYHSVTHSIKPRVFEFTDVEDYNKAKKASHERETSKVDIETGVIKDKNGGILYVREVFSDKKIVSYRAPFLCWSPPHLEALRDLGVEFDFSTTIRNTPCRFKGVTFYPSPLPVDSVPDSLFFNNYSIASAITGKNCKVLMMHPASLLYERHNNFNGTEQERSCLTINQRSLLYFKSRITLLDLLFSRLKLLQQTGVLEITPPLTHAKKSINMHELDLANIFGTSMWAPRKFFHYEPRYLFNHFISFFGKSSS